MAPHLRAHQKILGRQGTDVRAVATSVVTVFLDPTKAVASYASRIVSVDDIKWPPNLDAAKQRAKTEVE
jgi:hypothetical protein